MKHFLEIDDLSREEILEVLNLSFTDSPPRVLEGISLALVFEKPSLRTRNSTEAAIFQLGGHPVYIGSQEVGIDQRESAEDVARTLASYHGFIGARVFEHSTLSRMIHAIDGMSSEVAVINLLSDSSHPCQALADLATIKSHFGLSSGIKVAYVGDSNNVARSLSMGCLSLGMEVGIASPATYSFSSDEQDELSRLGRINFGTDPSSIVEGAHVIYTDVWTSMGQEEERSARQLDFDGFCVDSALVSLADKDAVVMHCLPAHDGEEISREVLESSASVIWEQARNRMNVMRGLLLFMSGVRPRS